MHVIIESKLGEKASDYFERAMGSIFITNLEIYFVEKDKKRG